MKKRVKRIMTFIKSGHEDLVIFSKFYDISTKTFDLKFGFLVI